MPKIKNKRYRQFLDDAVIDYIKDSDLEKALNSIRHKFPTEARALLITLYWTGARPVEILSMTGKSVWKDRNNLKIKLEGKKKGKMRTITLPLSRRWITELYKYSTNVMDNIPMFPHFISKYERTYLLKNGSLKKVDEISRKLNYWVQKWFSFLGDDAPNAYFLRHNRFSQMSEAGASPKQIMIFKGARTIASVDPYLHLSTYEAKKIQKYVKSIT